jgi:phosphoadenosine phosphosulfate reductase
MSEKLTVHRPQKNRPQMNKELLQNQPIERQLEILCAQGKTVFSTSFGMEDQVITHFIAQSKLPISIFTLDTGRLFDEIYQTHQATLEKYNSPFDKGGWGDLAIKSYFPEQSAVEKLTSEEGFFSFRASVEQRKACCGIRKVAPLKRALSGFEIWITGLRREQSPTRTDLTQLEWDAGFGIWKFHPLLEWTWEEVKQFAAENDVPVNPLHEKGYPSIGCAPCTRAISENEDWRAGRWWWEQPEQKECGLHFKDGKLVKQV